MVCISGTVLYETTGGLELCGSASTLGAGLSDRPINDLLNHEDLVESVGESHGSRVCDLKLLSDCFRPSNRAVEDFGRRGSTASAKYSWFRELEIRGVCHLSQGEAVFQ